MNHDVGTKCASITHQTVIWCDKKNSIMNDAQIIGYCGDGNWLASVDPNRESINGRLFRGPDEYCGQSGIQEGSEAIGHGCFWAKLSSSSIIIILLNGFRTGTRNFPFANYNIPRLVLFPRHICGDRSLVGILASFFSRWRRRRHLSETINLDFNSRRERRCHHLLHTDALVC